MSRSEIVVDMAFEKGRYNKGQAYVACSHVAMLDKLFIKKITQENKYMYHRMKKMKCNGSKKIFFPQASTCYIHSKV